MDRNAKRAAALGGALLAILTLALPAAADWPQWGGPERNFTAATKGLAAAWPEGGPKRLWQRELGEGYSGLAVVDGRLYTLYREGGDEVVIAVAADSGKTVWQHRYPVPLEGLNTEHGPGPHATPLVVDGRVFTVGSRGRLLALDAASGEVLWRQELISGLGGTPMDRGYSGSPLAYRDTVIATVGGEGHAVMALRQKDGAVVWQSQDFRNSPSSPLLIRVDGQDQLVAFMAAEVAGLDPATGRLLWSHPHRTRWGLNISLPLWSADGLLFLSSAYDGGSRVLRLGRQDGRTAVEELWFSNQMRLHFTNAIRIGDRVYGSSGDFGPVPLTAVAVETGEVLWRDRTFSKANLILLADGKLLLLDEDGTLGLATPGPEGLVVHAQAQVLDGRAWTVPTLVGRRLYVRDRKQLLALELPGAP